jgi:hypothetical protein
MAATIERTSGAIIVFMLRAKKSDVECRKGYLVAHDLAIEILRGVGTP